MEYVRTVDDAALAATSPADRFTHVFLDHASGGKHCSINWIRTPAGSGSPAGLHTHVVDQIFYVLEGTMNIEVEGKEYLAGPGSLVVFPAGVPHRNWNGGSEATVHLAFNTPLPNPNEPFARPV
jgi:quercetin dioxygenase-like cupin family protein